MCTFPSDRRRPVFDCEGFETEAPEPVQFSGSDVMSAGPRPDADPEGDALARYKGLCGNCESRDGCMYPRPEGGVWHCEEYT
jgi:hypothetical protein